MRSCLTVVSGLLLLVGPSAHAQRDWSPAGAASPTTLLRWRELGPAFIGIRINDIAVPMSEHTDRSGVIAYVATPGGIFRTRDGGISWASVFDSAQTAAVGRVTVAPSAPEVVWAGTGDCWGADWVPGRGIYKSTDSGSHWMPMGFADAGIIGGVVVHPRDPNVVYVGVLGQRGAPSSLRGVYKTTDGGRTWAHVLMLGPWTGVVDLAIDQRNPDVLYAAAWETRSTPIGFSNLNTGSGLYRSTNAGQTWAKVTGGFPTGVLGRIGVTISAAQPGRVYAVVVQQATVADSVGAAVARRTHTPSPEPFEYARVYHSEDAGAHWIAGVAMTEFQHEHYGRIVADPVVPNRVYILGYQTARSDDGGRTIATVCASVRDIDNHAMWIDPSDTRHFLIGSDFGLWSSEDGGANCRHFENIPGKLVYSVDADRRQPFYFVYGSMQDGGSFGAPSRARHAAGVGNSDWRSVVDAGGEDGGITADPADTNAVYNGSDRVRYDQRTGESRDLSPAGANASLVDGPTLTSHFVVSAFNARVLYWGGRQLFKSTDRGNTWHPLGPPFVTARPDSTPNRWGFTESIWAVAESPVTPSVLYVGTGQGDIYVSTDTGATWRRGSRPAGMPAGYRVGSITPSITAPGTAYATWNGVFAGRYAPLVYKTTDFGAHWVSIVSDLPAATVWVLKEHNRTPALLFVGTDAGVFASLDGGGHWVPLRTGMPAIRTMDLVIQPDENDLVAATWGRGIYVLDDLRPLEDVAAARTSAEAYLVPVRPTVRFHEAEKYISGGAIPVQYTAPNPPYGAPITYHLSRDIAVPGAGMQVLDSAGAVVRTLAAPLSAGWHRITWDLTTPLGDTGQRSFYALVPPGTYRARLQLAPSATLETPIVVRPDPMIALQPGQYDSLFATLRAGIAVYRLGDSVRTTARQVRDRLKTACDASVSHGNGAHDITAGRCADVRSLTDILQVLRNVYALDNETDAEWKPSGLLDRLEFLLTWSVPGATAAPTATQYETLGALSRGIVAQRDRLRALLQHLPPALLASTP